MTTRGNEFGRRPDHKSNSGARDSARKSPGTGTKAYPAKRPGGRVSRRRRGQS